MKRFVCLLAALALLPVFAFAETPVYEDAYPFTLYYNEELFVPGENGAWVLPNVLRPRDEASMASLSWYPLYDAETPEASEEISLELDLALPCAYSVWEADGTAFEQLTVYATDEAWVFLLLYPADDPDGWGAALRGALLTLEFPPQAAVAGSFRLDFFQGGAAGMRFLPVVVEEDADPFVLMPRDTVTDFVLERLEWDFEGFTVASAETVYAADVLEPGDNLLISSWFTDVLPTLRVRCVNAAGQAECWYLFQSGRDGSLMLWGEDMFEGVI
ncbi:MAG: hypothetical protein IJS53_00840 [Clostridia bacterium]|nr:hypothetical protein [Clostridia bacterium]